MVLGLFFGDLRFGIKQLVSVLCVDRTDLEALMGFSDYSISYLLFQHHLESTNKGYAYAYYSITPILTNMSYNH